MPPRSDPVSLLKRFLWRAGVERLARALGARVGVDREYLALRYIRGRGIEIGAGPHPLRLARGCQVTYVDHAPTSPGVVVADAQRLAAFGDASLDFVVANHVIEHLPDPLGALQAFFRVVRPGGIVFLAIPDKRFTFDRPRPETPLAHLVRDHEEGPERFLEEHCRESAEFTPGVAPEDRERLVSRYLAAPETIHFHCWTQAGQFEFLAYARASGLVAFDIEAFAQHEKECLFVLRSLPRTPQ